MVFLNLPKDIIRETIWTIILTKQENNTYQSGA